MKKNSLDPDLPVVNDSLHSVLEWLALYGKKLIYAFIALLALIFLIFQFSSGHRSKAETEYFEAESDFILFQRLSNEQNPVAAQETLEKLSKLIEYHPELQAKYGGIIAQTLINQNQIARAKLYSTSAFQRIAKDNLPFFLNYAKNTFTIAEKNYKDALNHALSLQEDMLTNKEGASEMLQAFNLLRIGMLQQELGEKQDEIKTWQTWTELAKTQNSIKKLNQEISEGKITLGDYIDYRQNVLKQ